MTKRKNNITPVEAAGGVVCREDGDGIEVVIIYRNNVWDLPKGKRENDESIEACARREVAEEIGIPLPEITGFLTNTYHEYERDGIQYGKTTHWFSMKTGADTFSPQEEEGIARVVWRKHDDALTHVAFDNLRKVLHTLKRTQ